MAPIISQAFDRGCFLLFLVQTNINQCFRGMREGLFLWNERYFIFTIEAVELSETAITPWKPVVEQDFDAI